MWPLENHITQSAPHTGSMLCPLTHAGSLPLGAEQMAHLFNSSAPLLTETDVALAVQRVQGLLCDLADSGPWGARGTWVAGSTEGTVAREGTAGTIGTTNIGGIESAVGALGADPTRGVGFEQGPAWLGGTGNVPPGKDGSGSCSSHAGLRAMCGLSSEVAAVVGVTDYALGAEREARGDREAAESQGGGHGGGQGQGVRKGEGRWGAKGFQWQWVGKWGAQQWPTTGSWPADVEPCGLAHQTLDWIARLQVSALRKEVRVKGRLPKGGKIRAQDRGTRED